jgi:hypothetical protein
MSILNAQQSRKVLFLGNSYTGVNNLPKIIHGVALSVGDTLIYNSHTPGGSNYIGFNAVTFGIPEAYLWDF